MKYLLDSHVFLWWILDSDRLSETARVLISEGGNELFWSAAGSWEISIKYELGRLPLPEKPSAFVEAELVKNRINSLPIVNWHTYEAARLPLHHKDPFDRILVAQSRIEDLPLITADRLFGQYDVKTVW